MVARHLNYQCICNKIYKLDDRVCEPGSQYLCEQKKAARSTPKFRFNGVEIDRSAAIQNAARLLAEAKAPLITGLNLLGSRSISRAISVAKNFRSSIDVSSEDSAETLSLVREGSVSATIGELVRRTDRLLLIDCEPTKSHPRLLKAILSSDKPTEIAIIKSSSGPTVELEPDCSFALELSSHRLEYDLVLLQALITGCPFSDQIPAQQLDNMARLVDWLRSGSFVSILTGALSESCCDTATSVCKSLNQDVKAVSLHLRQDSNAIGAELSLAARTGFPRSINFAHGPAKCFGDEYSAKNLLARGEVDTILTFDNRLLSLIPSDIPVIVFALPAFAEGVSKDQCQKRKMVLEIDGFNRLDDVFHRVDHLSFQVNASHENEPQISNFLADLIRPKISTL